MDADRSELAARLAEIATEMADQPDLSPTLEQIVDHAREATSGDAVGVMTRHRDRVEPVAANHRLVEEADALQLACNEGPCMSAALTGPEHILIDDTATDERWPVWGPKVADLGWRSILSIRLWMPTEVVGALNIYAKTPAAFDEDDVEVAAIFGRHASIALAAALEVTQLRKAISARHVVGQAQGILMERFDVDAERAFGILRRYSQDSNIKLRTVAEHIIEGRRLPS